MFSLGSGREQILNAGMRMLPMAAKLALTLYIGTYYPFEEIGAYGLVMGTVVILTIVLGQRIDYVVNHDIIDAPPATIFRILRDEGLLLAGNYAIAALLFFLVWDLGLTRLPATLLIGMYALTILENLAGAFYGHYNAMHRQIYANALFFVRSGLWVLPLIVWSILDPSVRTAQTILGVWSASVAFSLVLAFWGLRGLPWQLWRQIPVDWAWLKRSVKTSALVWVSNVGFACGLYVDRFMSARFLDLQAAGIVTFYTSFTLALFAVVQSGVLAFAGPRLVQLHKKGDHAGFKAEADKTERQVLTGAGILSVFVGTAIPLFGLWAGRRIYFDMGGLLAMLLFATWLRGWADFYYSILFARRQDKPIWLGDMLFLIPALGGNAVLVPLFGLWGVGVSSIASALFLLAWRAAAAKKSDPKINL